MTIPHSGHVADSGVQRHSTGEIFPLRIEVHGAGRFCFDLCLMVPNFGIGARVRIPRDNSVEFKCAHNLLESLAIEFNALDAICRGSFLGGADWSAFVNGCESHNKIEEWNPRENAWIYSTVDELPLVSIPSNGANDEENPREPLDTFDQRRRAAIGSTHCPACGGQNLNAIPTVENPIEFDCNNCGFEFDNPNAKEA